MTQRHALIQQFHEASLTQQFHAPLSTFQHSSRGKCEASIFTQPQSPSIFTQRHALIQHFHPASLTKQFHAASCTHLAFSRSLTHPAVSRSVMHSPSSFTQPHSPSIFTQPHSPSIFTHHPAVSRSVTHPAISYSVRHSPSSFTRRCRLSSVPPRVSMRPTVIFARIDRYSSADRLVVSAVEFNVVPDVTEVLKTRFRRLRMSGAPQRVEKATKLSVLPLPVSPARRHVAVPRWVVAVSRRRLGGSRSPRWRR